MKHSTKLSDLPHFAIVSVERSGDGYLLRGRLSTPDLVEPGRAWLRTPTGNALHGHVSLLGAAGLDTFQTSDEAAELLDSKTALPVVSSFWDPDQVDAILDANRQWSKTLFVARPAFKTSIPGWQVLTDSPAPTQPDQVVVDAAWDHEHCLVCSASISVGKPGFVDGEHNWLCPPCHETYAIHHDLSFLLQGGK